ncbi:hypothetical protein CDEF62S_03710 [Castellaniella defragrans]
MKTTRRDFLISSAGAVSAMAFSRQALAADHVDENSPLAKQLGYKHDASLVDAKAQPKFKPGEHCANCQLYQGKPGDAWGPCPIFQGKDVSDKGWCSAYTPKA